jgi:hypothetical protein
MTDNELLDGALAAMVRKSGIKIQKDDPILLNALVIQSLFREQAELARQMGDEMIRAGESNLEASSSNFSAILASNARTHQANSGIFLDSLREILAAQAGQNHDMDALAAALYGKIRKRMTMLFGFQIILMACFAVAVALLR